MPETNPTERRSFPTIVEVVDVGDGLVQITNAWACERCGGVFVGDHYSASHCNELGVDVQLCGPCCEKADAEHQEPEDLEAKAISLWEDIGPAARARLCFARVSKQVGSLGEPLRMFVDAPCGDKDRATDATLTKFKLLGDVCPVHDLNGRRNPGRWLTPLGVKVATRRGRGR